MRRFDAWGTAAPVAARLPCPVVTTATPARIWRLRRRFFAPETVDFGYAVGSYLQSRLGLSVPKLSQCLGADFFCRQTGPSPCLAHWCVLPHVDDDDGTARTRRHLAPCPVSRAPDLIVYFGDLDWRSTGSVGHDSLYSFETEIGPDDAVHAQHGIFIMRAPGIDGGKKLDGLHIMDGAPTVLSLLGVPVPPEMEGKSIYDMLKGGV